MKRILLLMLICSWTTAHDQALSDTRTRSGEEAATLVQLAKRTYDQGKYRQAVKIYGRASKIDPRNAEIFVGRGMAFEMLGRVKNAVEDYQTAIRIDKDNYVAMENLAGIYERSGKNTPEAIALYRRAFELDPRPEWQENLPVWIAILESRLRPKTASAVDLWNEGNEQASKGRFKSAHKSYSRALVLDPLLFQAYYSRGLLRLERGYSTEAVEDFDEALMLSPLLPGGLVARGLALEKLGKLKEAESDFEEAARRHPRAWEGWYHLARMLEKRKAYRLALAGYEKVLKLKSKAKVREDLKRRISILRRRFPARGKEVRLLVPPFRHQW